MKILVATDEEYALAKKYISGIEIIKTGVGASNVIKVCSNLSYKDNIINIGFCGSTNIPVGTVCRVNRSHRLMDDTVQFEDYRNGFELCTLGVPCYTSNSFVTHTFMEGSILFDMELNYIVAFPFRTLGAIKIVSDNLNVEEYAQNIVRSEEETWATVNKLIYKIGAERGMFLENNSICC